MQNLKNNTNESVYKSETDSQTQKANYGYQRGKKGWSGKLLVWDLQIQTTIYKIDKTTRSYCIAQGTIFNTLITYNGKEYEKDYIYV